MPRNAGSCRWHGRFSGWQDRFSERDVIVGGAETVDYIVSRSAATGEEYLPEQVHGVVATQLDYLRAIGAVGPPTLNLDDAGESSSG